MNKNNFSLKNSQEKMWDKKEKEYPRYNPHNLSFEKKVLHYAREWGVNFKDKDILEIGCGTGKYTLLLAQEAKKVYGVDFSSKMLQTLNEDAQKYNLTQKIKTQYKDFNDFELVRHYDIVFASMTPALKKEKDYFKMHEASRVRVYLGWGGKRESIIMSDVFSSHGLTLQAPNGAEKLIQWLQTNKIKYKNRFLETTWNHNKPLELILEDMAWHIKMRNVTPNKKAIKDILLKYANEEGFIENKTDVRLELIVW